MLVGPGENAGVVDIGDGLAAAFKMESHNHPSYIEPYQGAATGVGGILRDVFTMGARPIALLNSLRFGDPSHPKTAWLLDGVVRGHRRLRQLHRRAHRRRRGRLRRELRRQLPGQRVHRRRAARRTASSRAPRRASATRSSTSARKTGRDGIHGATMASAEFDEKSEEKRPTVQVGDPFTEKLLLEACLELFQTDALVGIQDMGAAGLTSSSIEMAGRAGSGHRARRREGAAARAGHDAVRGACSPRARSACCIVAKQGREDEVLDIFDKWDLDAAVIGASPTPAACVMLDGGKVVADLPVTPLTDGAPVYDRPTRAARRAGRAAGVRPAVGPGAEGSGRGAARAARAADHREQGVGLPRSTTTSCGSAACVLPGRGDAAVVRVERGREGPRARGRLQRALRLPRPVRGRAAGGRRVRAQRLLRGRRAARAHRLPELRQPRAAGDHVAVRRGDAGLAAACRELGRPGREREREPLQRDRGQGDPPHADRRRGGAAARRERRPVRRVVPARRAT